VADCQGLTYIFYPNVYSITLRLKTKINLIIAVIASFVYTVTTNNLKMI